MPTYRERPLIRKGIEKFIEEGHATLEDIARGHKEDYSMVFHRSMKLQARKMLQEASNDVP